jgi:hypothetical protein
LPTDFAVSKDGKSAKSLGYINNIHPDEHTQLHKTIEKLVGAYIPLFERALTDSILENKVIPSRVPNSYRSSKDRTTRPVHSNFRDQGEYDQAYEDWKENRTIVLPDVARDYVPGSLEKRKIQYSLAGRTIQVIVKLANIHLVSLTVRSNWS